MLLEIPKFIAQKETSLHPKDPLGVHIKMGEGIAQFSESCSCFIEALENASGSNRDQHKR